MRKRERNKFVRHYQIFEKSSNQLFSRRLSTTLCFFLRSNIWLFSTYCQGTRTPPLNHIYTSVDEFYIDQNLDKFDSSLIIFFHSCYLWVPLPPSRHLPLSRLDAWYKYNRSIRRRFIRTPLMDLLIGTKFFSSTTHLIFHVHVSCCLTSWCEGLVTVGNLIAQTEPVYMQFLYSFI